MASFTRRSFARDRRARGSTLLLTVCFIVVLGGLTSLCVDWGRVQASKVELERAADAAAARAGLSQLATGVTAAQIAAVTFAAYNTADGTPVVIDPTQDIDFGTWDSNLRTFTPLTGAARSSANAVRVSARRTAARGNAMPLLFGPIVGAYSCDAAGSSTVAYKTTILDYTAGFTGATSLSMNGAAVINGANLRITTTTANQNGSAWNTAKVPVGAFSTYFYFQLTSPTADGFTFTIQGNSTTTVGGVALGLGSQGMAKSVALKFDIYNNSGEGTTSTGLYLNGATPTNVGSIDTSSSGVNFRSGHVMKCTLVYDGTTLVQTVVDQSTSATFTQSYVVNIPANVGNTTGFVGFTGGTGGSTAVQNITQWYYTTPKTYTLVN